MHVLVCLFGFVVFVVFLFPRFIRSLVRFWFIQVKCKEDLEFIPPPLCCSKQKND
eukprot:m.37840 g.37840  ORF g.37840 m.37840 type:complete len:55 (+) comp16351_c0_seq1:109-273(+)